MKTLMEFPERCDHPLEFVTLEFANEEQSGGGSYIAHAIVRCHKCGGTFRLYSDYSGGWKENNRRFFGILCMKRCST